MVEHGGHILKYKPGGKEAEMLTGTKKVINLIII